jgi:23S rRNA pseudouridine1911/1915/1917 synthase
MNASEPSREAPAGVLRSVTVPAELGGERVDRALTVLLAEFSRSRLSDWIRRGLVTVDGEPVRPRDPVVAGSVIAVAAPVEAAVDDAPEDIALDVRHEDADLFIINKPAGLVVHPGAGNPAGTLQNALLHRDPALAQIPRAGIVHRLDKDTSGLMVVARTLKAHARLVEMLAARDIHRQYEALVVGSMVAGGSVDAPIDRHPRDRVKMAVVDGGREAVTHYRVRERFPAHTLLEVRLETGRTHQIRVHMAHIRHPLVGDAVYGTGLKLPKGASPDLVETLRAFRRQALHAEKLEFAHPVTGKPVSVSAARPTDLDALLAALRVDRDVRAAGG